MATYQATIEATIEDPAYAQELTSDREWLQAQWPAAVDQAVQAGKTVTGNPAYASYSNVGPDTYHYLFNVPVN